MTRERMSDQERYVLAKKIARGGMAEIYLGKHVGEDGFQRLCAIKRILPHYAQDQEFIQMFRDEAHICKRLQHANIVRVEGFEEVEGSFAIIMEYVDGADLRTLLHAVEQGKKKMPVPFACFIVAEAARGLHFAHTKEDEITQQPLGIVHRDISPQNILVSYEGEVKVTDFGIADAESKLTETRPGIVKGKYSYMSPEQISAKAVDARTDVFALSIVLWEMLAMRRLFQGDNEVDTIQRVKNCKIDLELRELNKEVDEDLDGIVKRGLAKDPKKRFKTAGDFEKELRRYMSRRHPDFTPEDLGSFLKKLMETRRTEAAADIKKTLTETNLRPGRRPPVSRSEQPLEFPEGESPKISPLHSLARQGSHGGSAGRRSSSTQRTATGTVGTAGLNRSSRTGGTQPLPTFGLPRRGQGISKLWFVAALALLALGLGLKFATGLTAQPKAAQLLLRAQPSRVKIMVNDQYVNQGRYVRATSRNPLRITIKPGEHEIKVSRAGYHTYRWSFNVEDGDKLVKDDIVLKERAPLAAVKIKARGNDRPVKFDIDDGYFVATLIPGKVTAVAPDVLQGRRYKMKVTVEDGSFHCLFTPKSTSWRQPNEVVIDVASRRCSMTGP